MGKKREKNHRIIIRKVFGRRWDPKAHFSELFLHYGVENTCMHVMAFYEHILKPFSEQLNRIARRETVIRYGSRVDEYVRRGFYRPLIDALKVWTECVRSSSTMPFSLRECMRRVLGRWRPDIYYYLRYLGLYMTRDDARLFQANGVESCFGGFLYPLIKIIFTMRYEESKHPFIMQIEVAGYFPAYYLTESGEEICLDRDYLLTIGRNLYVEAIEYSGEPIETIVYAIPLSIEAVLGIDVRFGYPAWGFEYMRPIRWCLISVQKMNLYGSFPIYEYYCWILRRVYPYTNSETAWYFEQWERLLREGRREEAERALARAWSTYSDWLYRPILSEEEKRRIMREILRSALYRSGAIEVVKKQASERISELEKIREGYVKEWELKFE